MKPNEGYEEQRGLHPCSRRGRQVGLAHVELFRELVSESGCQLVEAGRQIDQRDVASYDANVMVSGDGRHQFSRDTPTALSRSEAPAALWLSTPCPEDRTLIGLQPM